MSSLVKQGYSPIDVAVQLKKEMHEVARMLLTQVGEGELTYADIFFSIDDATRHKYEDEIERRQSFNSEFSWIQSCRSRRIDKDERGEIGLYELCRDNLSGDMYRLLRQLEYGWHQFIRRVLEKIHPGHDDAWWVNGVPSDIREKCVLTRERDPERYEPYAYTTFIDLKSIVDKKWSEFVKYLPKNMASDKNKLMKDFVRLNAIRNRVMHPTKLAPIVREDYEFVRLFGQMEAAT
jgi:hypothetical protein